MSYGKCIYRAEKTVSSTALTILTENTAALLLHGNVNRVEVNVIDQPVRYTMDGTTPTATLGRKAAALATVTLLGQRQILLFQMIREGGTDAEVEVTFFAD